jgi:hypothetical protein
VDRAVLAARQTLEAIARQLWQTSLGQPPDA